MPGDYCFQEIEDYYDAQPGRVEVAVILTKPEGKLPVPLSRYVQILKSCVVGVPLGVPATFLPMTYLHTPVELAAHSDAAAVGPAGSV